MHSDLQHLHEYEVTEKKRAQLYLVGMLAISSIVVTGLVVAIRWIALTVGG